MEVEQQQAPTPGAHVRPKTRKWVAVGLVFLLALVVRLGFINDTRDFVEFVYPVPGMDVQLTWEAASALLEGVGDEPNFELKMLSAPAHGYWLALCRQLFGDEMLTQRVVAAVFSAARIALLFLLAWELSAALWAALLSAGLLIFLPSLVYFDSVLLKVSFDMNLLALCLWALFRWARPAGRRTLILRGLGLGALLSIGFLSQLNTFLYVVPIAVYVLTVPGWQRRERWLFLAPLLGVFAMTFVGYQQRSLVWDEAEMNYLPRAGVDLRIAFNPTSTGFYNDIPNVKPFPYGHAYHSRMASELRLGKRMNFAESNAAYMQQVVDFLLEEPGKATQLVLKRMGLFVNKYEVKGVEYLPVVREQSAVLRALPLSFAWLFVLGMVGLFACVTSRKLPLALLLGGLCLCVLFVNCITLVNWRFRIPVTVPLMLLTAVGLGSVRGLVPWGADGARGFKVLALGVVIAASVWLTNRTVLVGMHEGFMVRANNNSEHSERHKVLAERLASAEERKKPGMLFRMGRYTKAFALARDMAERMDPSVECHNFYVRRLLWLNEYEKAAAHMQRMRRELPGTRLNLPMKPERYALPQFVIPLLK